MTPTEAAAAYLSDCKARPLAQTSLDVYRHAMKPFLPKLPDRDFSEIAGCDIDAAWRALCAEPSRGPNTLRLFRVIMARWLDWCVIHAGLAGHSLRKSPLPKKTVPRRPKVTVAHLVALRAACGQLEKEYLRRRALAIVEVLWSSLLRRNELLYLRTGDLLLDADPPMIRVSHGKGGWNGTLPISDVAVDALRAWLSTRGSAPNDWLFCNQGQKRLHMSVELLMRTLKNLADIAGIDASQIKPHAIRRGGSTAMLQGNIDIATVSAALRHRDIQTTWLYVGASQERLNSVRNWMAPTPSPAALPMPPAPATSRRRPMAPRDRDARTRFPTSLIRPVERTGQPLRIHVRGAGQ